MIRPGAGNPEYFFSYIWYLSWIISIPFILYLRLSPLLSPLFYSYFCTPLNSVYLLPYLLGLLKVPSLACLFVPTSFSLSPHSRALIYQVSTSTYEIKLLGQACFLSYRLKFSNAYLYIHPQVVQVPLPKTI